jgi:pyrimidine-specific ribonucleoside hydrolase
MPRADATDFTGNVPDARQIPLPKPRAGRLILACALLLCFAAAPLCAAPPRRATILVDTDAGSDDLMAIAFLLARTDAPIEAITVANGLAHVGPGANNILRLLELAGRRSIPVYMGREKPLRGDAEFPQEWRTLSDELPGVQLPATTRKPETRSAADFLVARLRDTRYPVRILALGPLTNLGEALRRDYSLARNIREIVIMGGAVRVPGNLNDGGYLKTDNITAEWNLYVDPLAARLVFSSGARIRLVPLDATNKVPIDLKFLEELERRAATPLGRFVAQVLETDRKYIEQGIYCAWDPLAAAALVEPAVVKTQRLTIEVRQDSPETGRTVQVTGKPPNAAVALDAAPALFRAAFLRALGNTPATRR